MVTFIYCGTIEIISFAAAQKRAYGLERQGCEILVVKTANKTEYFAY